MTYIELNINRLNHLLRLYQLSKEELLHYLNRDRKKALSENEVFGPRVPFSILKKIDIIFKKGYSYYIDPQDLQVSTEESIFFRKDKFNAELSFGAKQIVTHFEEEKITFSALSKLSDFKTERTLPYFTIKNNPKKVSEEIRKALYPKFNRDPKIFLKSLISKFAENNIVVFEFIENWNKKEKANINGFYLSPNVIVLKRQKSYRREIFTLIHELGHYLLNLEEIDDEIGDNFTNYQGLDKIEKWCNDFTYHFLVGEFDEIITGLEKASAKNDYHHEIIKKISSSTNLSEFALFTRLRINNTISFSNYKTIKEDFENQSLENEERLRKKRELDKEEGRKSNVRAAKPILSPLYVDTIQSAFIEGIIGEIEFCKRLNVKPENIWKYFK